MVAAGLRRRAVQSAMKFRSLVHGCSLVGFLFLAGCGSDRATTFPLETLRSPQSSAEQRATAIDRLSEAAKANEIAAQRVRTDLESIVRSESSPRESRVATLTALLASTGEKADTANRKLAIDLLPTEREPRIVSMLAAAARERNWTQASPALIRSLARANDTPVRDRDEAKSLAALAQGRSLEELLFEQFVNPSTGDATGAVAADIASRVRVDAWDVLAQLDPTGQQRQSLLARPVEPKAPGASAIAQLKRATTDLRVLASSGSEVTWLLSIKPDAADKAWWQEVTQAVARVPQSEQLSMRHLEAIRLANRTDASLLSKSREELLSVLESRIASRRKALRVWKAPIPPYKETLGEQRSRLSWADALTILTIDTMLTPPFVREALVPQARADEADRSTEYGGVLVARTEAGTERVWPVLYVPRAGQRRGDMVFNPSDDMLLTSGTALAHFHLHAQETSNVNLAGPAEDDVAYANLQRRACVLFTPLGDGKFNVDYYGPGSVVVDLGTLPW